MTLSQVAPLDCRGFGECPWRPCRHGFSQGLRVRAAEETWAQNKPWMVHFVRAFSLMLQSILPYSSGSHPSGKGLNIDQHASK